MVEYEETFNIMEEKNILDISFVKLIGERVIDGETEIKVQSDSSTWCDYGVIQNKKFQISRSFLLNNVVFYELYLYLLNEKYIDKYIKMGLNNLYNVLTCFVTNGKFGLSNFYLEPCSKIKFKNLKATCNQIEWFLIDFFENLNNNALFDKNIVSEIILQFLK